MHLIKSEWEVRPVTLQTGLRLVRDYHYSGSGSNTFTYLHGLFQKGELFEAYCWGVAWWIPPTEGAAIATYPDNPKGVLNLSRLVIIPGAPTNSCSFFLGSSRRLIDPDRWPCLVTYADGWKGHEGKIYRADNWQYLGLTDPERVYTLEGRLFPRKHGQKTYLHQEMLDMGCQFLGRFPKHKFIKVRV